MSWGSDFWSRRKAGVAAEADAERSEAEAESLAQERAAQEERPDEEILAELDLKDPDLLEQGDDFSGFLNKAVPERLRRRALRRLWTLNPALANLDGLVDYGEDFTDAAMAVENIQTAYQVGKGMLKHILAQEEAAKAALAEDEPPEALALAEEVEESDPDENRDFDDFENRAMLSAAEVPSLDDATVDTDAEPAGPAVGRRMRFEFEPMTRENTPA